MCIEDDCEGHGSSCGGLIPYTTTITWGHLGCVSLPDLLVGVVDQPEFECYKADLVLPRYCKALGAR
jgi:hypothetical protein